jgi:sugar lactone lactonase YvrE
MLNKKTAILLTISCLLMSCTGFPFITNPPIPTGVVTTIAGSANGFSDGTGSNAIFNTPRGISIDSSGNLFVADSQNHKIRKITPAGVVTTIAGSTGGFADGTGSNAQFNSPDGLTVDSSGNLFVADTYNYKIRKITPEGVVSTIAGSTSGFADGTGSNAQFGFPQGLAVDSSGNVFVADASNNRIRKITPAGVVSTFAGSDFHYKDGSGGFADGTGTNAQFYSPGGITIDRSGNLFVTDTKNGEIKKITPAGVVTTLAGNGLPGFTDGTGSNARFYNPEGITVDSSGNLFVADSGNQKIRKVTPEGVVSNFAGSTVGDANGTGTNSQFFNPSGLVVDNSGNIFVSDANNSLIRKIKIQ